MAVSCPIPGCSSRADRGRFTRGMRALPSIGCFVVLLTSAGLHASCRSSAPADRTRPNAASAIQTAAAANAGPRALNPLVRGGGDPVVLSGLLSDGDVRVRQHAAYVAALWADTATDAAALHPVLGDSDEGVRAMVAGSLIGLGDPDARRVLNSLVASRTTMPWSDPVITVGLFARRALASVGTDRRPQ